MRYVIKDYVEQIEERFVDKYESGVGKDAVMSKTSIGWFVVLGKTHMALYVGDKKPEFIRGQNVKLSLEAAP